MSTPHNGGPAFPHLEYFDEKPIGIIDGMSLRDYFAAKAMVTFGSALSVVDAVAKQDGVSRVDCLANASYELADAMLKAREAKP